MIFCSDARDPRAVALFAGTNSKDRFSHILSVVVANLSEEELITLGCERKDIAPYSARKGAATFANGQIAGPNPVTVQLCMGHSLGKVNDPYLHFSDPQDQLCGRQVALLPILDHQFGTLPPHFNSCTLSHLSEQFWNLIVPGYSNLTVEFKPTLPYLLASLLYHEDYLRNELDMSHPISSSRVFSANCKLEMLRTSILTGFGYCSDTGMQATGLPPHIIQDKSEKLQ